MDAYNPLDSMRRLEAAGLERRHAEAIAGEINDGTNDLETEQYFKEHLDAALDAALNKQTIKIGIMMSAMIALTCTIIGVLFSLK